MLSGRPGATASMAIVAVLLLVAMPTTTGATDVGADEGTLASYVEYFLGDLFQNIDRNTEPKSPPRFRPWKIFDVSGDGVLAFDCAGDVPTLRLVVPGSDDPEQQGVGSSNGGKLPQETCGGGPETTGTPVQYKLGRTDKPFTVYSALFWACPGGEKKKEEDRAPVMPLPKLQLKAILKTLAATMEAAWRNEKGEQAMPESVPFPADTVAFYVKELGVLVVMGREDVEFHKQWKSESLDGKIRALTLGVVI